MNAIGIDPDTKDLAVALWTDDGPAEAFVVHAVGKGQGEQSQVRMARLLLDTTPPAFWPTIDAIAIEGQQIDGRRAKPDNLFTLAHTTGSALAWCARWFEDARIIVTPPREWKGAVAKHAMQARLYTDLRWGYTLHGSGDGRYAQPAATPSSFRNISPGQWKHVGDALLLARWAHEHQA